MSAVLAQIKFATATVAQPTMFAPTVPHLDGVFLSLYSANLNYSASAWAAEFAAMKAVGISFAAVRAALQGTSSATAGGCTLGTYAVHESVTDRASYVLFCGVLVSALRIRLFFVLEH